MTHQIATDDKSQPMTNRNDDKSQPMTNRVRFGGFVPVPGNQIGVSKSTVVFSPSSGRPLVFVDLPKEQLLRRNVKRFRGGLVLKVHRLLFHPTLGLRVIKKKKKGQDVLPAVPLSANCGGGLRFLSQRG